jgi:hypothetical protein
MGDQTDATAELVANSLSAVISAAGGVVAIVIYCREVHTAALSHPGGTHSLNLVHGARGS